MQDEICRKFFLIANSLNWKYPLSFITQNFSSDFEIEYYVELNDILFFVCNYWILLNDRIFRNELSFVIVFMRVFFDY
jgi:hypothetical protein